MDLKEEIKNVIENLEFFKFTRRTIEKEIGYGKGYLDETISRGGNGKLLAVLKLLLRVQILENTIKEINKNVEFKDIEPFGLTRVPIIKDEERDVGTLMELTAITNVLSNYVVSLRSKVLNRDYEKSHDEFDEAVQKELQRLVSRQFGKS